MSRFVIVLAAMVLLAACGGDGEAEIDSSEATEALGTQATPTTGPPTTTIPPTTTAVTAASEGIRPTAQNVESSIGEEATFCGRADAITERGDGLQTVYMGALLVYVEPNADMSSRWWEDEAGEDREFCVTGTVQPGDERGSAFITVTDGLQVE